MSDPDRPIGEFGLIDWIAARAQAHARVPVGIGDDCAELRIEPGSELLVTTDMLMDGQHFRLAEAGPEAVGYKAPAVNLSDIAAMAGRPLAAFVAVALPRVEAVAVAQGLLAGMLPLAERFGVALAGGDTNAWDGPLVVSVTVVGESVGGRPVLRSGAGPGDAVFVTGPLGGSLAGRHLRPVPRIEEALRINGSVRIKAMIDLSDGLSSDLAHILRASGDLGAVLDAERIPIHDDARALASRDGRAPIDHALDDGEDFELCFTVAPADAERLETTPPDGVVLFRIGRIEPGGGLRLRRPDGSVEPLRSGGFDHLAPRGA